MLAGQSIGVRKECGNRQTTTDYQRGVTTMDQVGACWCDFIRVIGAVFMRGLSPLIRGLTSGLFQGPPHGTLTSCTSLGDCGVANKQVRGSQLVIVD
jgi:hypothetical protein